MITECVTCGTHSEIENVKEICVCSKCKTRHWIDTEKGDYFRVDDGKYGRKVLNIDNS